MTLEHRMALTALWATLDRCEDELAEAIAEVQAHPGLVWVNDLDSLRHQIAMRRDELAERLDLEEMATH